MKNILLILTLSFLKISAQDLDKIVEIEKDRFLKESIQNDLNYPGDPSYDVVYYKLNIEIIHTPQYLSGVGTVKAKSLVNDLSSFYFDLSNVLEVDSVISSNQKLIFEHSDNKLTIQTASSFNLNEEFSVSIYYRGTPQTTGLGSFVFDSHNGQPSIWTLSEPYGASDWWPCKDTPADKADSADIWITCSSDFFAVSNGVLTESLNNGNGTTTYKWKSRYPIANYLISLAISDFTFYQQYYKYSVNDSMPVVHYIYPDIFQDVKANLDKTILMMEIFSDKFGPYPFIREKYGHSSFGRGGMEHQTISSMGIFTEQVIAHELAHQWFGDKVTCEDWNHIWLNEGFATFSEGVYYEAVSGKEAYDSFIFSTMARAKTAKGSIYLKDVSSIAEIFNGPRSYLKGAIVLHMLRGITGDSLFFQILRNYLNDPELAYGVAVTEDFQRIAEEIYGNSLDYFFQQWIYGENYPRYFIDWSYKKNKSNLYEVKINIEQAVNSFPTYFTMPLQVKISTSVKDTILNFFNDQQVQSYLFYIEGEPTNFIFDPLNSILDDAAIYDPPLFDFRLEQNYPNPFNNVTTINFRTSKREKVVIKIYDILGNEIETIFNQEIEADKYEINYDASLLSSGVYFYRMHAGDFVSTKKLVFLK